MATENLSGSAAVTSIATAKLSVKRFFSGSATAISGGTASLPGRVYLSGSAPCVSATYARLTVGPALGPDEYPADMTADFLHPYSGGAWLWLYEIVIPSYDTLRHAANGEDVAFAGHDFGAYNFSIGDQTLTADGSIPQVVLKTSNAVKTLEEMINATEGAYGGTVKILRVNDRFLDQAVPAMEYDFDLLAAESDEEWVSIVLGVPNPMSQRIPLRSYSASRCPYCHPDLFKGVECGYTGGDASCTGIFNDCYAKGNAARWGGFLGLDPNAV